MSNLPVSAQALRLKHPPAPDVDANGLACLSAKIMASSSADISVLLLNLWKQPLPAAGIFFISGSPEIRDVSRSSGGDIEFGS
jgi:hypothetical protein